MKTETKNAPTPWKLNCDEPHEYRISDAKGDYVINYATDYVDKEIESKEIDRLRFIIKAVNCHEELLEACKNSLHRFKKLGQYQISKVVCSELEEIIAKAEANNE